MWREAGSPELTSPAEAFTAADGQAGWAGEETDVVVRERRAGYISPAGLRQAVVIDLAVRPDAGVRRAELDVAGTMRDYDAVVLAAGAWTTTEWDVPAGSAVVTASWHDLAVRLAVRCFPLLKLGQARRRISAADCYCDPPVLTLREVAGPTPRLFTFTGGSGGCAKSALAASQRAASQLEELT